LAELRDDGPISAEEIRRPVESLSDVPSMLADAYPKLKSKLYAELGISIRYEPGSRVVIAEARPACADSRVGGRT
jgi:hypothetical protein